MLFAHAELCRPPCVLDRSTSSKVSVESPQQYSRLRVGHLVQTHEHVLGARQLKGSTETVYTLAYSNISAACLAGTEDHQACAFEVHQGYFLSGHPAVVGTGDPV